LSSANDNLVNIDEKYESDIMIRTFILFSQTSRRVLKYVDACLYKDADLSLVQLITLHSLAVNNGVMTPSEIAKWTQTERNNITTLVQCMKHDGLVTTEVNNKDRRVINVTLTDKGWEVFHNSMPVSKKIVDKIMFSLSEDDVNHLAKLLTVLRGNAQSGLKDLS